MSESEKVHSVIPSNEQIVDELTKDLESQCIRDDTCLSETKDNDKTEDDESHSEKDESDELDFIDIEMLKDMEVTLTAEQKEAQKQRGVELKNEGNQVFKQGDYLKSLALYTEGLNTCPLSFQKERAILFSNRAATKMKLGRTESAIEDCTEAITLDENYIRALLRRAQLYEQTDKLDEALADYKKILELDSSVTEARRAVVDLPPKIEERNEKLKTEMLGKLKDLGNLFLRPFGLSTDNFQLNQDPSSGGYTVNFSQNKE